MNNNNNRSEQSKKMLRTVQNAAKMFTTLSGESKKSIMEYLEQQRLKDIEKEIIAYTPEQREALRSQINGKGEGKGKLRKRAKKEKDPNAPKGVKKGYFFFAKSFLPEIKAQDSALSHPEAMKKCGEAWGKLSEDEKKPYLKMEAKDRQRYDEAMKNYSAQEKNTQEKSKKRMREDKDEEEKEEKEEIVEYKKEKKDEDNDEDDDSEVHYNSQDPNDPEPYRAKMRAHLEGFSFFCENLIPQLQKKNKGITEEELQKKSRDLWDSLSEDKRQVFRNAASEKSDNSE